MASKEGLAIPKRHAWADVPDDKLGDDHVADMRSELAAWGVQLPAQMEANALRATAKRMRDFATGLSTTEPAESKARKD